MLYSLNGTAFSFLSNTDKGSIPVVRTNPLAIYGDNLVYWLDFTDTSTLFSNTGATVNVSGYGDTIRAIRSKSSYGQLLTLVSNTATTYTYSAKTNLNSYGGIYRAGISSDTTNVFNETTNSIITANTVLGIHIVYSMPLLAAGTFAATQWFFKLAGFGFLTNGRLYFAGSNQYLFTLANSGNSGDPIRVDSPTINNPGVPVIPRPNDSLTFISINANPSGSSISSSELPANSSKSIYNNNYFGPRVHGSTLSNLINLTGTIRLQLGGTLPTGAFFQEIIVYQKDIDDVRFRAGHQYLRDKYLS